MNDICGSYIFSSDDEFFLYDLNCNVIMQVSEKTYKTIKKFLCENGEVCNSDKALLARFFRCRLTSKC